MNTDGPDHWSADMGRRSRHRRRRPFPAPLDRRPVLVGFTRADVVTVPSHLAIAEVRDEDAGERASVAPRLAGHRLRGQLDDRE